jgi:hypothetical protein
MFALAQTLGRSVRWVERNVNSRELSEWIALLAVEPWGPYRADLLNAINCYAVSAPWCKGTKVSDWMPQFEGKKELDGEQLLLALKSLGGKVRGNDQQDGDQPSLGRPGG